MKSASPNPRLQRLWQLLLALASLGSLLVPSACGPVGKKACKVDNQCNIGQYCDPVDGRCKEGCNSDERCPSGQSCYNTCGPKVCEAGSQEACYTGPEGTKDVGTCKAGVRYCIKNGQEWSPCLGETLPRPEVCDSLDNDCDGETDENLSTACDCHPGRSRLCYTGPPGTLPNTERLQKTSACRQGVQYCSAQGQWGPCLGQILPRSEFCNRNQRDDNCDGIRDNPATLEHNFPCCKEGDTRSCWLGARKTALNQGTQTCITHEDKQFRSPWWVWGPCQLPAALKDKDCSVEELGGKTFVANVYNIACNGKDDDCDGTPDNRIDDPKQTLTRVCAPSGAKCEGTPTSATLRCEGICKLGLQRCQQTWSNATCEQAVEPKVEVCNGKDDDCDGQVDNLQAQTRCFTGKQGCTAQPDGSFQCEGSCQAGLSRCEQGQPSCVDQILPKEESVKAGTCNDGLDNDCDGKKDSQDPDCACQDGDTRPCYDGKTGCTAQPNGSFQCVGACKTGVQRCNQGQWGACENAVTPRATEICGNNQDDNCNGKDDKSEATCQCNPGTRPCYTGPDGTQDVGTCKAGTQTCQSDRTWGACQGEVTPGIEDCQNNQDDDCDGQLNNGCP